MSPISFFFHISSMTADIASDTTSGTKYTNMSFFLSLSRFSTQKRHINWIFSYVLF